MSVPAGGMNINSAFNAIIKPGSSLFTTYRAFHVTLPYLSIFLKPFSSLSESIFIVLKRIALSSEMKGICKQLDNISS